jgi:hypothetical protein
MPSIMYVDAECRYAECRCAECYYAECRYAECHYAECRYAECHYAECHYAECRGAKFKHHCALFLYNTVPFCSSSISQLLYFLSCLSIKLILLRPNREPLLKGMYQYS